MNSPATTQGALEHFVQRARQLYSLPAVAMQVLELTESERVDVPALRACIEVDPALTSKILRVVNSSMFGLSGRVNDLDQALALLGTKPLKLLVLGFSLPCEMFEGQETEALGHYWRAALTKAVAARELSLRYWKRGGDEAFIAGLLADIGMLLLMQTLGGAYTRIVTATQESGGDLDEVELETLGFRHTFLSARMLEHWNFPSSIVQAVAGKEPKGSLQEDDAEAAAVVRVVHLAGMLSALLADRREDLLQAFLEEAQHVCNLRPSDVPAIVALVEEQVAQLSEGMSLTLSNTEGYGEIFTQAQEQLATLAEEAAAELATGGTQRVLTSPEALEVSAKLEAFMRDPELVESPQAAPSAKQPRPVAKVAAKQPANVESLCDERLAKAVIDCRRRHWPLTLLLAEIEYETELDDAALATAARWLQSWLTSSMEGNSPSDSPMLIDDRHFALLLPGADRQDGLEKGRDLLARFQATNHPSGVEAALRIGVASIAHLPANFLPRQLAEAAERCLFAAQAARGSRMKSIDLF